MKAGAVLAIEQLSIALPVGSERAYAVRDVSLEVRAGEVVCVVGESGSGKSTLAHAVLGLLPAGLGIAAGCIRLGGDDLAALPPDGMRRVRGRRVSMIFQEPMSALNPLMQCGAQIREALWAHGQPSATQQQARLHELLESVGIADVARAAHSYPFQLSGGQRQRVMIAMALALEPEFLIADEPTTALDVTTQAQILRLLLDLQQRTGLGVLLITHDFGVVAEVADRVAVMKDGALVEIGTRGAVLGRPQHSYTRQLLAAVPSAVPPERPPASGTTPLLQVTDLRKTYVRRAGWWAPGQATPAVCAATFHLHRGETLGLVGESGSGKSTIGRILAGLVRADGGAAHWRGADLLQHGAWHNRALRRSVQMIFQDPYGSLNPRHRVATILTSGLRAGGMPKEQALARARELLALVQLDPSSLERFAHEFSGGQRQRLGIARAIAAEPELVIADEPVSALDVSVQQQVLTLLQDLKQRLKLSMLFITHDLRVAAQLCDRLIVLRKGEIVETGETRSVLLSPQHHYTQQLLESVPGRRWMDVDKEARQCAL